MADDDVAHQIKIMQTKYPQFVNSNGTIEYELLMLTLLDEIKTNTSILSDINFNTQDIDTWTQQTAMNVQELQHDLYSFTSTWCCYLEFMTTDERGTHCNCG